jgi:hypothetical protein
MRLRCNVTLALAVKAVRQLPIYAPCMLGRGAGRTEHRPACAGVHVLIVGHTRHPLYFTAHGLLESRTAAEHAASFVG